MKAILFVALLFDAEPLQPMDNVAPNPSFEEDKNHDERPDGWQAFPFESPAKLAWDALVAHSGKRSLRISDSARPGAPRDWKQCTGRWVSASRPVEPGSRYTLQVWVKTQGVTGRAYAHLSWQRNGRWLSETPPHVSPARRTGKS